MRSILLRLLLDQNPSIPRPRAEPLRSSAQRRSVARAVDDNRGPPHRLDRGASLLVHAGRLDPPPPARRRAAARRPDVTDRRRLAGVREVEALGSTPPAPLKRNPMS